MHIMHIINIKIKQIFDFVNLKLFLFSNNLTYKIII